MSAKQETICVDNVGFWRGRRKVLDGVSCRLQSGTLTALIGHNGAGKSTLIKTILGLIHPAEGNVTVLGRAPGSDPLSIGYLPENISFYEQMTMQAHLEYFADLKGVARSRVDELLEALGLSHVRRNPKNQCSKGQRQRLGLAQALLAQPRIMILDEPTVGLDPQASSWMYAQLAQLRSQGCTVIVCTHELSLIEPFADVVLMLAAGKLRASGSVAELRRQANLPAVIRGFDAAAVAMTSASKYLKGDMLCVPDHDVAEVVRVLTEETKDFDFDIRKFSGLIACLRLKRRRHRHEKHLVGCPKGISRLPAKSLAALRRPALCNFVAGGVLRYGGHWRQLCVSAAFGRHEFTCEPHGLFAAASGDTSELRRVCGRTRRRHADFDAHLSSDANGVFTW